MIKNIFLQHKREHEPSVTNHVTLLTWILLDTELNIKRRWQVTRQFPTWLKSFADNYFLLGRCSFCCKTNSVKSAWESLVGPRPVWLPWFLTL